MHIIPPEQSHFYDMYHAGCRGRGMCPVPCSRSFWYNTNRMKITIKLFATLLQFGPPEQESEVADNCSVAEVIEKIGIPDNIPLLRIVNGVHVDPGHRLGEGDVLALFPPIAGGWNGTAQQSSLPLTVRNTHPSSWP